MADERFPDPGPAPASPGDGVPESPQAVEESVEALRQERDALARRAAETHERYLRALADFDNYRKRIGRERDDWRRQAQEQLLREILPVLDNFDRALATPVTPENATAFREGVELIHRDFLGALERLGARPFPAVGQPFDPTRHEAVGRVEQDDVADATVVAETLRGYLFQDRVLRPAHVVVAVPTAAARTGGEGTA